ncbi:hypothetical protein BU14_0146s0014 [Porphyra umbilicalis]|uniref:Uncharacterized protein n=1 Tax=Porphyra umbilicalis TaxID=2786 RepID=A0A1X6PA61_PORUM|nr:hypothetical protein BU14_0146s0014 [Porphyra umbilicalis]|eukprot:OSX77523.1 hypothetical protein BU14_0146s0014 [Porphyra umbilicalis]
MGGASAVALVPPVCASPTPHHALLLRSRRAPAARPPSAPPRRAKRWRGHDTVTNCCAAPGRHLHRHSRHPHGKRVVPRGRGLGKGTLGLAHLGGGNSNAAAAYNSRRVVWPVAGHLGARAAATAAMLPAARVALRHRDRQLCGRSPPAHGKGTQVAPTSTGRP